MLNNCGSMPVATSGTGESHSDYRHRKVWREGLEVGMKIKALKGESEWYGLSQNTPYTAIHQFSF
jgi:hypothetical protein